MNEFRRPTQNTNVNDGMVAQPKFGTKSINNQYEWIDGTEAPVIARYMKTTSYALGGFRRNPNTNLEEDFILMTDEEDFSVGRWGNGVKDPSYYRFNYNNEVVELYSDYEHKAFLFRNKKLLDEGKLVEYDNTEDGKVMEAVPPDGKPNPFEDKDEPLIQFGR